MERLVIVAAPSGAGKTTFLRAPESFLAADQMPEGFEDLPALAAGHQEVGGFRFDGSQGAGPVCLHVDLHMPLRQLKPASRDELLTLIEPGVYAGWAPLRTAFDNAEVVEVLTLNLRREVLFERWLYGNHFAKNPGGGVRSVLAAINGDGSDDDALHRAVYRAWAGFVAGHGARRHAVLEVSEDAYRQLPLAVLR